LIPFKKNLAGYALVFRFFAGLPLFARIDNSSDIFLSLTDLYPGV